MSRVHRFFLQPLEPPKDWRGNEDPRAPRLIFRGLTVGESARNINLGGAGQTVGDIADALAPCILRCEGVWGMYLGDAGDTSPNTWPPKSEVLRHILQEDLDALFVAIGQATMPRKEQDLDPL